MNTAETLIELNNCVLYEGYNTPYVTVNNSNYELVYFNNVYILGSLNSSLNDLKETLLYIFETDEEEL